MRKLFAVLISFYLVIAPVNVAHANGAAMAAPILGIANGIMGAAIITKCKMGLSQPSILVYLAAGLTFVASEMIAAKKKAKDIDDSSKALDELKARMSEGGDYQQAAIQAQMDDEKSNLEFVQKRRKWMLALKVLYTLATALALTELILKVYKDDTASCTPNDSHKLITTVFALAYGSLLQSQNFGKMVMGVASGLGAKAFLSKLEVATKVADKGISFLTSSIGRSIFFGGSAALIFIIDADLAKQEKNFESNIATIQKVKDSLPTGGSAILEVDKSLGKGDLSKDPSKANYAIKALPKATELAKHCISGSATGAATDFSPEACKNPMKISRPKFDANFNAPTLKMATNTGLDFAQAIANGDMARADVEAGNLAAMAGRIDKIKDDMLKKVNDKLKAEGKKTLDINGEVNRQVAALNDALTKANLGTAELGDVSSGEASVSEKTPVAPAEAPVSVNAPMVPITEVSSSLGSEISEPVIEEKPGSIEEKLSHLDVDEKDISQESDVSIFKQVSNRYFLNYTKIFEKSTPANPPLEPKANK